MMKKTLIAASLLALFSQAAMAADDWRFAAGVDSWNSQGSGSIHGVDANGSYDDQYNWTGYLQVEHDIFLLPNAKFEITDFSTSGGSFNNDLEAYDLTLYYRLLNNDLFKIDLGLTGRQYDGKFHTLNESYDEGELMAYTGAEVMLPGTGFSFFGDARIENGDHYDYRLGAAYQFSSIPVQIRAGWRDAAIDSAEMDQGIEGWFIGGAFRF